MATETETRPSTDSKPAKRPTPRPRKPAPPDVCRLTLAIRGVPYTVRLLAADPGADVARLIRLRRTGDRPATYFVALTAHGASCDCGDQTFRHEGRETACKHIRACRALGLLPLAAEGERPMKNILAIIDAAGGMDALAAIRIDPPGPGYMRLCIERIGDGPNGFPLVSVAHYHEQNGDLVADPEMTFEVAPGLKSDREFFPVTFEMPGMGVYRRATWADAAGKVWVNPRERKDQASFARTWDRNLRAQGFLAAFQAARATGRAGR